MLGGELAVTHAPKTIDNDLRSRPGVPTFGFTSTWARTSCAISCKVRTA